MRGSFLALVVSRQQLFAAGFRAAFRCSIPGVYFCTAVVPHVVAPGGAWPAIWSVLVLLGLRVTKTFGFV